MPPTTARSYFPPGIVLLMLLLLVFLFLLIGQGLGLALTSLSGVELERFLTTEDIQTTLLERNVLRGVAALNQFFTFCVPPLLLGWFLYRRRWVWEMTLDRSPGYVWPLKGALWIMAAFPWRSSCIGLIKTPSPCPSG